MLWMLQNDFGMFRFELMHIQNRQNWTAQFSISTNNKRNYNKSKLRKDDAWMKRQKKVNQSHFITKPKRITKPDVRAIIVANSWTKRKRSLSQQKCKNLRLLNFLVVSSSPQNKNTPSYSSNETKKRNFKKWNWFLPSGTLMLLTLIRAFFLLKNCVTNEHFFLLKKKTYW